MPDESNRLEVAQALAEALGPRVGAALMEVIPPFGWHEIATKSDLTALERRLDARFDVVDARFEAMDRRFDAHDERFRAIDERVRAIDDRFDAMRAELLGAMHQEGARLLRWMVTGMIATVTAVGGIVAAVAALN